LGFIVRALGWVSLCALVITISIPIVDAAVNWKRDFVARGKVTHKSVVPRNGLHPEEYIVTVSSKRQSYAVAVSSRQFQEVEIGEEKEVYETSGIYVEPMGMD
jgi:hypothetical protein